jgi:collagenase-like PrtC family protease
MFRINCPLTRADEVAPLVAAGADGFYAGLFPEATASEATASTGLAILNRRNHPENNFQTVEELLGAQAALHEAGRELFVTFNEHFYPAGVLSWVWRILDELTAAPGLTGVILADLGLAAELHRRYDQLVLKASTGVAVFNSGAVRLVEELGIRRVVLPRAMTLDEIAAVARACPDVGFECFVLNDRCPNVDGLCHFVHCDFTERRFPTQCRFVQLGRVYRSGPDPGPPSNPGPSSNPGPPSNPGPQPDLTRSAFAAAYGAEMQACGACALSALVEAGIGVVKIVGRDRSLNEKLRAVEFLAAVRRLLQKQKETDRAVVTEEIKALRRRYYAGACHPGLCYFSLAEATAESEP